MEEFLWANKSLKQKPENPTLKYQYFNLSNGVRVRIVVGKRKPKGIKMQKPRKSYFVLSKELDRLEARIANLIADKEYKQPTTRGHRLRGIKMRLHDQYHYIIETFYTERSRYIPKWGTTIQGRRNFY